MDCKNFDALDDMCKACLSGGTSTNPKEQKCYEAPVEFAVVGQPSAARQLLTFAGLIIGLGGYTDDENDFN